MDPMLIAALLRTLSIASSSATFGENAQALAAVAALAARLVELGVEGEKEMKELNVQLEEMVRSGRNPTFSEWDALRARSDAAHAVLQR